MICTCEFILECRDCQPVAKRLTGWTTVTGRVACRSILRQSVCFVVKANPTTTEYLLNRISCVGIVGHQECFLNEVVSHKAPEGTRPRAKLDRPHPNPSWSLSLRTVSTVLIALFEVVRV
jgi:hypothetical protein